MCSKDFNIVTGTASMCIYVYLANKTPEYSWQIALGLLVTCLCFGGVDTIASVIKTIKGKD